jgi:hypothetical protein
MEAGVSHNKQKLHKVRYFGELLATNQEGYNETLFHRRDQEAQRRAQFRLRRQAAQTGISTHPHTKRMMFLGGRLVGSDLRA